MSPTCTLLIGSSSLSTFDGVNWSTFMISLSSSLCALLTICSSRTASISAALHPLDISIAVPVEPPPSESCCVGTLHFCKILRQRVSIAVNVAFVSNALDSALICGVFPSGVVLVSTHCPDFTSIGFLVLGSTGKSTSLPHHIS